MLATITQEIQVWLCILPSLSGETSMAVLYHLSQQL
jgi:hypothetical protein